jgi:hypothetical protein
MLRLNQTIIRELTVCALLKLEYWCQLKYFVIKLFGRVAAYRTKQADFLADINIIHRNWSHR